MAGQMSLFDIVSEEDKKEFEIRMPQIAEYTNDVILAFEKDVLGIYLSGHPLEQYRSMMEKMISAKTSDFQPDDETGIPEVYDNQKVIVGGMITDKTIKYTKNNKVMAFLTLEDLVGTVEIVVFPRDYEKCLSMKRRSFLFREEYLPRTTKPASLFWKKSALLMICRVNCGSSLTAGKTTQKQKPTWWMI